MKWNKEKEQTGDISLLRTFTADLRGKQSVRATFKLTEGCIDAISIVAAHLGIKQKSLFDHLVEDTRYLSSIAREIQNIKLAKEGRIQKTFVISRKTLSSLDKISRNFNAPRDALVEYCVQRLLPVIEKERKKHHQRKEMLVEINAHIKEGGALLKKIHENLGTEDPIYQKLASVMMVYKNSYNAIQSFVERGKIIEDFQPEDFQHILISHEE